MEEFSGPSFSQRLEQVAAEEGMPTDSLPQADEDSLPQANKDIDQMPGGTAFY